MKNSSTENANQYLADLVKPFGPQIPLIELIPVLNDIYHRYEAQRYDRRHPEIFQQLEVIWREMLQVVIRRMNGRQLKVLDYGCGTGFELRRLIEGFAVGDIKCVNCFDPSSSMLAECNTGTEYGKWRQKISFTDDVNQVLAAGPYDLILTNSVMHHIYDYESVINSFHTALCADGFWVSGHEPSARFYKNEECWKFYQQYRRRRMWRRCFSLERWRARLSANPARLTATQAFNEGLFGRKPDAATISRLVDCWVANDPKEAEAGRGFDYKEQQVRWCRKMKLVRRWTYSYLGPLAQVSATRGWQKKCVDLARRYPDDGANYCSVWQKERQ